MMSIVFLLLSLLGICLATPFKMETELEPLSDEEISYINTVQSSWKAGRNFKQEALESAKKRLGVDFEARKRYKKIHSLPVSDAEIRDDLPKEFDSREKWPQCKSIREIRDQSECGSCWAFGPVEAMTDRECIHNKIQVHLSTENIVACDTCTGLCNGCHGGFTEPVWEYYQYLGVVSGGKYNSSEGCWPYSLPPCEHHTSGGKYKPCPKKDYPTPVCTLRCRKGYGKTYEHDKHYGQKPKHFIGEQRIMQEIVDNGPVSASFRVYSDFLSYKSGVYKHTTGPLLGGHAIKIIGYGVEKGQKYWLAANSWNEDWGDKGFFKIAKGINECTIEHAIIAANPREKHNIF